MGFALRGRKCLGALVRGNDPGSLGAHFHIPTASRIWRRCYSELHCRAQSSVFGPTDMFRRVKRTRTWSILGCVGFTQGHKQSWALLGGLVGIASEIVALSLGSSPQSLSGGLVYLSDQYILTAVESQRMALAIAAEGLLAGANAVSSAGILTAVAILILSLCMLRGVYHRGVAILGIAAGVIGIVSEAFRPQIGPIYGIYGLLLPAWFIAVGLRLCKMGFRRIA